MQTNDLIRLLLVEDNPGDAELVATYVADVPTPRLELIHVARVAEATRELEGDAGIDAVLLDLGLPDSTGTDGVKRVLGARPDIPIIVLTGLDSDEVGIRAVQQGAEDYLVKGALDGWAIARSVMYAIERARLKAQVRLIVTHNVDAMLVISTDSIIRFVNRAAVDLFNTTAEDLIGSRFPHPIDDISSAEIALGPGDEPRICEMRIAPLAWDGERAFLASIRDVSDVRRAQRLEQQLVHADRLASIGQLAAGVAHEINNPLTFVKADVALLDEALSTVSTGLDDLRGRLATIGPEALAAFDDCVGGAGLVPRLAESHEMLEECTAGCDRIQAIVGDLASFSRIDEEQISTFDINDAVEVACQLTAHEIRHRARLVRSFAPLPEISADRARLIQVFVNLLVNAAQAIEAGAIEQNRVTVETSTRGGMAVVAIADTGSGIPEHQYSRVFEPFFTTKPRGIGTGLGLPIAAETVRKHGGELSVSSTAGEGSRFEVELPIASLMPEATAQPADSRRRRPGDSAGYGLDILVVDDDLLVLRSLRRVLQTQHRVTTAASGAEAIEILRDNSEFDVVLCDMLMPGVDGPELHAHIAEHHPELADRVVFLTGGYSARPEPRDGSPLVLGKPIAVAELMAVLDSIAS